MKLTNKAYDALKWIAQYLLPALGTLYFAVAKIWGLPYIEEVVGTVTAVDTFLAVILGISTANYEGDGTIQLIGDDALLELNIKESELVNRAVVMLKVGKCETENVG